MGGCCEVVGSGSLHHLAPRTLHGRVEDAADTGALQRTPAIVGHRVCAAAVAAAVDAAVAAAVDAAVAAAAAAAATAVAVAVLMVNEVYLAQMAVASRAQMAASARISHHITAPSTTAVGVVGVVGGEDITAS